MDGEVKTGGERNGRRAGRRNCSWDGKQINLEGEVHKDIVQERSKNRSKLSLVSILAVDEIADGARAVWELACWKLTTSVIFQEEDVGMEREKVCYSDRNLEHCAKGGKLVCGNSLQDGFALPFSYILS